MPRQNPFLRRSSSPGEVSHENSLLAVPPLPSHPAKLTQASFSDSALKVPLRPSTFKNTQPRVMSIRPSRFIKATTPTLSTSSPLISSDNPNLNNNNLSSTMLAFIKLFDTFTQKLYIEGYLMKHNTEKIEGEKKPRTKMFVELSGSTLTLWDTEIPGSTVMPTYLQINDTTIVYSNPGTDNSKKKKFVFSVQNKKTIVTFESSDESSMLRWISAIRLSCFEKQKLHQLFTLKLLASTVATNISTTSLSSSSSTSTSSSDEPTKGTFLQVRAPGTSIWQKYWVVLVNKSDQHRSKRFGKKSQFDNVAEEIILLYETKKSKTPIWTLSRLTQAYAVYPESPQLIEKASMIRIDCRTCNGVKSDTFSEEDGYFWFMADHSQLTIQWLLAVYDTFKLYGRPETLLNDRLNPNSLNYGEPVQDLNTVVYPKLFLETDEVVAFMEASHVTRQAIDSIFFSVIARKQTETAAVTVTSRPTGTRTNSLPLITVLSAPEEGEGQEEKEKLNGNTVKSLDGDDQPASFKFSRHVADSSDESDGEDEDGDVEDDEEPDSDDEPIGRKSTNSPIDSASFEELPPPKSFVDSLIPDFDFGNGFDVPKNVTAAAVAAAISSTSMSQTMPTRGKQKRSNHGNSITLFQGDDVASNLSMHVRKVSMPVTASSKDNTPQQRSSSALGYHGTDSSSSMFGDFSLSMDFKKFLDEPLDQRKFSLPTNAKFTSIESSQSTSSSNHRWDHEWEDQDEYLGENQSQHPYDDDNHSYDSDFDGPLIPSLGDHFATQNSLLDTYLGEQLSAKEQIEFAKATGQPLIQVSSKKQGAPKGGLVGMISQREKDRKEGNGIRVAERVNQHNAQDRFEREKERRIFEQRQQQFMKHQVIDTKRSF